VPVLRALSAAKHKELLRNAIQHSVAPGTVLFEKGDVPNFQLVAMSGSAQLFGRSAERRAVRDRQLTRVG
jgi:CRP/FNR family transcriptional regulator, transcriptional activator FtrB